MVGARGWGNYNFYEMFCGSGRGGQPVSKSSGQKPFMMTETAATVHMAVQQTDGTWVRSFFFSSFLIFYRLLLLALIQIPG